MIDLERNFIELLEERQKQGFFVCVGLDSDYKKLPEFMKGDVSTAIFSFNRAIIDATKETVGAYKPNAAFYEAYGREGDLALRNTIAYAHDVAPEIPVIWDSKRADIGNTNAGYVISAFDQLEADAITVNPYFGEEALKPFLDRKGKAIIVLCRTSNPGAGEFQDLLVSDIDDETVHIPLYQRVAQNVSRKWNGYGNCMLVVGATYPEELKQVRQIVGDMQLLIPGIGAQRGDIEATVINGRNSKERGFLINSSRGVIFKSGGPDFAEAAKEEVDRLNRLVHLYLDDK